MASLSLISTGCGMFLLPFLFLPSAPTGDQGKTNRYTGAQACKNCHNGADKGDAYDHWLTTPHAKAYETLATPKAKEVAAKLKIDEPQKSEKCLKCHVTAYGIDAKEIKKGFKPEAGVQCESCHGPGEEHIRIRFKEAQDNAAPAPITPQEVHSERGVDNCSKCHNKDSPTYKPFCLKERMEKIQHLDPRKKRSEADLKKLAAICSPDCPKCGTGKKDDGKKDEGKKDDGGKKDAGK